MGALRRAPAPPSPVLLEVLSWPPAPPLSPPLPVGIGVIGSLEQARRETAMDADKNKGRKRMFTS